MNIYLLTYFALVSGLLYRLGGIGNPWNTKFRDLGCALTAVTALIAIGHWHWSLLISAPLLFAGLTTYWTPKKQEDVLWWNWLLTGMGYGLAMLPYAASTGHWLGGIAYIVCTAVGTMLWSIMIDKDWLEEGGRGFILIANLPLLFIV